MSELYYEIRNTTNEKSLNDTHTKCGTWKDRTRESNEKVIE